MKKILPRVKIIILACLCACKDTLGLAFWIFPRVNFKSVIFRSRIFLYRHCRLDFKEINSVAGFSRYDIAQNTGKRKCLQFGLIIWKKDCFQPGQAEAVLNNNFSAEVLDRQK